jgi:hypothetical protein
MRAVLVAGALVLISCAPTRYTYAPVTVTSADMAGRAAVDVPVPSAGSVRLSTFGIAELDHGRTHPVRALHVRMSLTNDSDQPWSLDASLLRAELADLGSSEVAPRTVTGLRPPTVEVPPRTTREVDVFFPLPEGLASARELPAFDVVWTLRTQSGELERRTPFERIVVRRRPTVNGVEVNEPYPMDSIGPVPGEIPTPPKPPHPAE